MDPMDLDGNQNQFNIGIAQIRQNIFNDYEIQQLQELEGFEEDFIQEFEQYMFKDIHDIKEPNWYNQHIAWLQSSYLKQRLVDLVLHKLDKKHTYFYFGLFHEFGVSTQKQIFEKSLSKAIYYYEQGSNVNCAYSNFRLYYIYHDLNKQFEPYVIKADHKRKGLFYLVKGAAYFDYFMDLRYKQYPFFQITIESDNDMNFIVQLREAVEEYSADQEKQFLLAFLNYWLTIYNDNFKKQNLQTLEKLAKQGHVQSCFWMAELIRNGEQFVDQDIDEAVRYYNYCIKQGMTEATAGLGYLYMENIRDFEKARECFDEAAKFSNLSALNESSSYIYRTLQEDKYVQGLEYQIDCFIQGFTYAADDFEFVLTKIKIQTPNIKKYHQIAYEIAYSFNQNYEFYRFELTNYGPQIYMLSDIYEKGIHVKQDYSKALKILQDSQEKIQNNQKYFNFRIAKLYKKLGKQQEAYKYFELALQEYISNSKKVFYQSSSLFNRIGKFYEKGYNKNKEKFALLALDSYFFSYKQNYVSTLIQNKTRLKAIQKFNKLLEFQKKQSQELKQQHKISQLMSICINQPNIPITGFLILGPQEQIITFSFKKQMLLQLWCLKSIQQTKQLSLNHFFEDIEILDESENVQFYHDYQKQTVILFAFHKFFLLNQDLTIIKAMNFDLEFISMQYFGGLYYFLVHNPNSVQNNFKLLSVQLYAQQKLDKNLKNGENQNQIKSNQDQKQNEQPQTELVCVFDEMFTQVKILEKFSKIPQKKYKSAIEKFVILQDQDKKVLNIYSILIGYDLKMLQKQKIHQLSIINSVQKNLDVQQFNCVYLDDQQFILQRLSQQSNYIIYQLININSGESITFELFEKGKVENNDLIITKNQGLFQFVYTTQNQVKNLNVIKPENKEKITQFLNGKKKSEIAGLELNNENEEFFELVSKQDLNGHTLPIQQFRISQNLDSLQKQQLNSIYQLKKVQKSEQTKNQINQNQNQFSQFFVTLGKDNRLRYWDNAEKFKKL